MKEFKLNTIEKIEFGVIIGTFVIMFLVAVYEMFKIL